MKALLSLAMALGISMAAQSHAADGNDELYDAVAPADSGFIRVLNLTDTPATVSLSGKKGNQTISAGNLGGYLFSSPGKQTLAINGSPSDLPVETRKAVTAVYRGGSLTLLGDDVPQDARKANVVFYNLTDQALSLKTADGKHALVQDVAPGQLASRKVNEIKIPLAAYAGTNKVVDFSELFLRKSRSYSFLVIPGSNGTRGMSLADTVDAIE